MPGQESGAAASYYSVHWHGIGHPVTIPASLAGFTAAIAKMEPIK
ncbi:invasion associated locus B family protein [Mesorhizobium sp. NZP2298]|nr:invasion associated locus B family protein [Mesorhizobium sp. NZP2298]